jgi:hypothetical protein
MFTTFTNPSVSHSANSPNRARTAAGSSANPRNSATTAPRGAPSRNPSARHNAGSPISVSQHPALPQ